MLRANVSASLSFIFLYIKGTRLYNGNTTGTDFTYPHTFVLAAGRLDTPATKAELLVAPGSVGCVLAMVPVETKPWMVASFLLCKGLVQRNIISTGGVFCRVKG